MITFNLSQAYQASVILASHSGEAVDPLDLKVDEELEIGAVARWAVKNKTWNERLKRASDVGEFFIDSLHDIICDRAKENVSGSDGGEGDDL